MSDGKVLQKKENIKEAPKQKKDLKYMRDRDREMVRGIFRFFEVPGGLMEFPFRKYKEDEVETYKLVDGNIYTIPRGVAYHLSNNCWYPEHAYRMDDHGKHIAHIAKKKRRCSFEPLDFMDAEQIAELTPSDIETVSFL